MMNLLVIFILIVCGLHFESVESFPTESLKLLPDFNISGTFSLDPDEPVEIPKISPIQAEMILDNLGYETSNTADAFEVGSRSGSTGSKRIRVFQRDNGLPETGILDDKTRLAIGLPRCGVRNADRTTTSDLTFKWSKSTLKYAIANFPEKHPRETIRALIKRAFGEWSRVTNLDFLEVADSNSADIEIRFGGKLHKMRTARCDFGNSNVFAHAFYPENGDIHFNTKYFFEENASLENFLDTALHEIGHSLGLEHSDSVSSLMYPTYISQFLKPQPIDVKNIQALYGIRNSTTTYSSAPTFCSLPKIDAIFKDASGKTYAFAGDYFYDYDDLKGQPISKKWPGLPGGIDAAFQYGNDRTYFFKGNKYYRFRGSKMVQAPSRTIATGFPGLPGNVNAVMVDGKGDIFVFKGSQYWIYNVKMKRAFGPIDIKLIGIVLVNVDAVAWRGNVLLSFKGKTYHEWTFSSGLSEANNLCAKKKLN